MAATQCDMNLSCGNNSSFMASQLTRTLSLAVKLVTYQLKLLCVSTAHQMLVFLSKNISFPSKRCNERHIREYFFTNPGIANGHVSRFFVVIVHPRVH